MHLELLISDIHLKMYLWFKKLNRMQDKIWLSSPHFEGNEFNFISDIFENKRTFWQNNISEFELLLESYLKENVCVSAVNSGTSALHLGLILLGVKASDEVICQSMTFSASANPIVYLGATPVFIDSEKDTWNMCPSALEKAILDRLSKGSKPKAIIVVDLFGMPYKIDEIRAVANRHQIPILEDAAEAMGSTFKGKQCGTFGDIGALSFNGNKIITTTGGGAVVTRSKEHKEKVVFLATQARDDAPHYQHSEIGYNYRMSIVCAGIGRAQMEVLDQHVRLRREMHDFYRELFHSFTAVTLFEEPSPDYYSNHWLSAIIIDQKQANGKTPEQLRLHLDTFNIESRHLWKPMHLQPVFGNFPYYGGTVAQELFEQGLCLPSGSNLTGQDRKRISDAIHQFFD